jgi:hypothetical protein
MCEIRHRNHFLSKIPLAKYYLWMFLQVASPSQNDICSSSSSSSSSSSGGGGSGDGVDIPLEYYGYGL